MLENLQERELGLRQSLVSLMYTSQYLASFLAEWTIAPRSPCLLWGTEDLQFRGYWTVTKLFKCSPNFVLVLITCKISKAVFVRSFWYNCRKGMHVQIFVKGFHAKLYNFTFGSSFCTEVWPSLELSEKGERKAATGQAAVAVRYQGTWLYLSWQV